MYCTVVALGVVVGLIVELTIVVVVVGARPRGVQNWFVLPGVHLYVCGAPVLESTSRHWSPPVMATRPSAVKYQCCWARPG
jgi:hypothetical protein